MVEPAVKKLKLPDGEEKVIEAVTDVKVTEDSGVKVIGSVEVTDGSNTAENNMKSYEQKLFMEPDVGISQYITDLPGFSGVIKQR